MVPGTGIEPVRLSAPDFKSGMSTNFITRARVNTQSVRAESRGSAVAACGRSALQGAREA